MCDGCIHGSGRAVALMEPLESVLQPVSSGLTLIGGLLEFIRRIESNNIMCVEIRSRAAALFALAECALGWCLFFCSITVMSVASPCRQPAVYERYISTLTGALDLTTKFWNNRNSEFAFLLNWITSKKYASDFEELMNAMDSVRAAALHTLRRISLLLFILLVQSFVRMVFVVMSDDPLFVPLAHFAVTALSDGRRFLDG